MCKKVEDNSARKKIIGLIVLLDLFGKFAAHNLQEPLLLFRVYSWNIGLTYVVNDSRGQSTSLFLALAYLLFVINGVALLVRLRRPRLVIRVVIVMALFIFLSIVYYMIRYERIEINVTIQIFQSMVLITNAIALILMLLAVKDRTLGLLLTAMLAADMGNAFSYFYPPFLPVDFLYFLNMSSGEQHILNIADCVVYVAVAGIFIRLVRMAKDRLFARRQGQRH